MKRRTFQTALATACLAAGFAASAPALAQGSWPNKPVRLIVPFPAGGSTDIVARVIAQRLGERLGQQVVVDNRGGAGGIIGIELAARSLPDGHTLLMTTSITHTVGPSLHPRLPYDVLKDFSAVTLAASVPLMLVVHPSLPVKTVTELLAAARQRPGHFTYSSAGNGTSGHLAVAMLKSMTGVDVLHVPYKGGGPAVTDLIAGQVHFTILSAVAVLPHVRTGKLRSVAVTTAARVPEFPDIPTVAESGVPGYEVVLWYGLFVPAGTRPEVIGRLNRDVVAVVNSPQFQERMATEGGRVVGSSPEDFERIVKADVIRWNKVVKEAGIRVE